MNIFKRIKARVVFDIAVRKADEAHTQSGERYYVMPSTDGKLVIVDRKNFRILKRKHYVDKDVNLSSIQKECFYCTPYHNGEGEMPHDIRQLKYAVYLDWVNNAKR